jgi:hypothetical protein
MCVKVYVDDHDVIPRVLMALERHSSNVMVARPSLFLFHRLAAMPTSLVSCPPGWYLQGQWTMLPCHEHRQLTDVDLN